MKTTLFSWGYYGWGNHTPDLIHAVDAVEKSRGFEPPIFVDIRIRRSVRAVGFSGANFEKLLGAKRHVWMKSLGNQRIVSGEGPEIQIAEPERAEDLLHFAATRANTKTRLIYFCSCQWPRCDGNINCHRVTVTELLQKAAKKKGQSVQLVEWPGGQSRHIQLEAVPEVFRAIRKGGKTIPLGREVDAEMLGLPSCSVVTVRSNGESVNRIVGPAMRYREQWCLPVLLMSLSPEAGIAEYHARADTLRRDWGFEPVET
ncbi:MAG: hypothetical protein K8U57_39075 [Planctomycetes bacterium]|nr:hypothetical protein [Planctomycetota bacterium]